MQIGVLNGVLNKQNFQKELASDVSSDVTKKSGPLQSMVIGPPPSEGTRIEAPNAPRDGVWRRVPPPSGVNLGGTGLSQQCSLLEKKFVILRLKILRLKMCSLMQSGVCF